MNQLTLEAILARIATSTQTGVLRDLRRQASEAQATASPEPFEANERINRLHDALIRQALALTEKEMENRGLGHPPVPYAFLLFGSGGRSEQTLWSDQDNGLVYADSAEPEPTAAADGYFATFASSLVNRLEALGYPPCEGDVICSCPQWRMPLSGWLRQLDEWLAEPDWEHMRYTLILADLRVLAGEVRFGMAIRERLNERLVSEPSLLRHLLANTLHRKVALGLFGQLITERYGEAAGGIDLKYGSYIPMVNAVRLLAMQAGLSVSSTAERLTALGRCGVLSEELLEDWRDAFASNLRLRGMVPVTVDDGKFKSDGKLPAELLTPEVKRELKFCLHAGERLQKFLNHRVEKEAR